MSILKLKYRLRSVPLGKSILSISLLSLLVSSCSQPPRISIDPANSSPINNTIPLVEPPNLPAPSSKGEQKLVLAGGCFWGVEAVFEQLKGVKNVVSGYSGGTSTTANYDRVSHGGTEHAEAVEITYDPQQISLRKLLQVYFFIAHDPTQINKQEPDVGTQYRSAIFFANKEQQNLATAYIEKLDRAHTFPHKIATQVVALNKFYPAEEHHQNFIHRNPNYPYVVVHDLPKLANLRRQFPDLIDPPIKAEKMLRIN